MTLEDFSIKIDLRLNKSASNDFDNIWWETKQEAANKAVSNWVRRQYRGNNQKQEGAEESTTLVDDLQVLLKDESLSGVMKEKYFLTEKLPTDYLYHIRITPFVSKGACLNVQISSRLEAEANADQILHPLPSFKFEETFHTIVGNKVRVYHDNDFIVNKAVVTYYRKPKVLDFSKLKTVMEFKDDVCEILVDEAAKIIASDINDFNASAITEKRVNEES